MTTGPAVGTSSVQEPDGVAENPGPPTTTALGGPVDEPAAAGLRVKARRAFDRARVRVAFWSRSLLVRVVVLTLSLSTIVMLTLGLILQQQIINGLLRSKIDAATAEIDSARQTVQSSLSGADSDPSSPREQLRLALTEIGRLRIRPRDHPADR